MSSENFAKALGMTIDEWDEKVKETWLAIRRVGADQADALIMAGWKFELPEIVNRKEGETFTRLDSEPWQWYWRAPVKGKRKIGRKYWSTGQAFNAMRKTLPQSGN